MPLNEYKAKRDFTMTREPAGSVRKTHKRPIFVVQEHHASVHHYDFRLEVDGVLKSWSVPKGPSLDPSVKRLAVQVEDHPIGYASFEGTIPQGQYGGGTVAIWDQGTYESLMEDKPEPKTAAQAIADGQIEFNMHGERLRGKFSLIRMKFKGKGNQGKPQWLLIKSRDEFAEADDGKKPEARPRPRKAGKALSRPVQPASASSPPDEVELTHPDRLMFPDAGLTKEDVFAYYEKVAGHLLPFLKDRPVTLERLPGGLAGSARFWQKDTPASHPGWIPRVSLETETGKVVHYALVNDEPTLLYLVNQGTLTFHAWASRVEDLDRPDFVLFDLDPGKAPFPEVVAVAKAVKASLDDLNMASFVKTSGKTGLHVLAAWTQEGGFDEARAWALEIAERVAGAMPERATVEIRKAKRGDRVYIDVLQNARGHHAVAPYVLRAVPNATVSTPLDWKEVNGKLDPAEFTTKKVLARVARKKTDPFASLLEAFGRSRH
ncbi:non-homologous end-joining DNA ligase [Singulisphaera sp. PoT]|uniref:non-homologous end-joining DNA ligase n=1 Tax=Singulisphaera sp. PoT TaxID=3411797 RepID=UPI003BF6007B